MKQEMFRKIEAVQPEFVLGVYRWELEAAVYSPASEVYICVSWRKP
jgi:hypothetical protein